MKLLQFFCLLFLAAVCINAQEESAQDEFDVSFYGFEDENENNAIQAPEGEEVVEEEESADTSTLPPTIRWSSGRAGRPRHHGHHGIRHRHRRTHHRGVGNWTAEQKLNYVCSKLSSNSNSEWLAKIHRKISRLNDEQKARVEQLMADRKTAISECCQKSSNEEKQQCAESLREARYERVCNGQEPLCIWAEIMGASSHTQTIVDRCCVSTGVERSTCFTDARQEYMRGRRTHDRTQDRRRERGSWHQ